MAWFDVLKEPTHETSYDLIACLDVLEHLPRASQAFEAIDSMLRPNGHLILSAPWGGYPEHIPAAAIDFYRGNGFHLLKTKYKLIAHFGRIHLNGIYKKK
jgi:2-polyprenyl-3-methyl-5-hydroxy-6-metoxy-1,4-benzoquinol methylase